MLPANQALILIAVFMLFGFANVFFGRDLFRPLLFIYGFLTGALLVGAVAQATKTDPNLVAVLLSGIIFGFLAYAIFYVGIFMLGAFAGLLLFGLVAGVFGLELGSLAILAIVIACGGLAVAFHDYVLMFATALAGSTMVAQAIYLMFPDTRAKFSLSTGIQFVDVSQGALVIGALIMVSLTILGTYMQWKSHMENPN